LHASLGQGTYRAYSSNAKFVNPASARHISFMAAAVSELFCCVAAVDGDTAYRVAFGFVREAAVTLRQALTSKTKEAFRQVYCWQVSGGSAARDLCGWGMFIIYLLLNK
jgi:nucleolar complex protein 2